MQYFPTKTRMPRIHIFLDESRALRLSAEAPFLSQNAACLGVGQ